MEIIFDIDGTIADNTHRQHFVSGPKKNWEAFFNAIEEDTPILPMVYLIRELYARDNGIILCTGRPEDYRLATRTWLNRFSIPFDKIYMRRSRDYRPDIVVKQELYNQMLFEGRSPQMVFEDRLDLAGMWKNNKLVCLLVK